MKAIFFRKSEIARHSHKNSTKMLPGNHLWRKISGFSLDMETLEKWEYTWKNWKGMEFCQSGKLETLRNRFRVFLNAMWPMLITWPHMDMTGILFTNWCTLRKFISITQSSCSYQLVSLGSETLGICPPGVKSASVQLSRDGYRRWLIFQFRIHERLKKVKIGKDIWKITMLEK